MPIIDLSGRESIAEQIKIKSLEFNNLLEYYVDQKDGNGEVNNNFNKIYTNNIVLRQYIEKTYDININYIIEVIVSNSTKILLEDILEKLELKNQILFMKDNIKKQ